MASTWYSSSVISAKLSYRFSKRVYRSVNRSETDARFNDLLVVD